MAPHLRELAQKYPAIAVLGPRQSGKTTLVKTVFPDYTYVNFENRNILEQAQSDPQGFLQTYTSNTPGIIIDEFQNFPELTSYLQGFIDEVYRPGFFILTGSQNYLMNKAISQSLAGRISILTLLPLSIEELKESNLLSKEPQQAMIAGGYPRIYEQHINPTVWYPDYLNTYVERDIRELTKVSQLSLFRKFVALCAGRIGQILNITSLCNDTGIDYATARSWLSLLESSYIIFLLQPHHKNFGKRLIKSPKLYFYDSGLACSLLGITSEQQLFTHYLRGNIFESYIISDLMKQYYNNALRPHLYFWRDSHGNEIDCIVEKADHLIPIEIKASQTSNKMFFKNIIYWNKLTQNSTDHNYVIYAGNENQTWKHGKIISWKNCSFVLQEEKITS